LEEEHVEQIVDGHEASGLSPRLKLALQFADAFFAADGPPPPDVQAALQAEFTEAELVEMGIGLALFHGVAKMLISLGCEPEQMDVGIHRTPGT
jgi:alkylhydroperoxidase family enzyme